MITDIPFDTFPTQITSGQTCTDESNATDRQYCFFFVTNSPHLAFFFSKPVNGSTKFPSCFKFPFLTEFHRNRNKKSASFEAGDGSDYNIINANKMQDSHGSKTAIEEFNRQIARNVTKKNHQGWRSPKLQI